MIKLWLADRLIDVAKDEAMASETILLAQDMLNTTTTEEQISLK